MSNHVKISNSELYAELYRLGYEIKIIPANEVKLVEFNGKFSVKHYRLPVSYNNAYTDAEIIDFNVKKLMKWASLRLVIKLEHY